MEKLCAATRLYESSEMSALTFRAPSVPWLSLRVNTTGQRALNDSDARLSKGFEHIEMVSQRLIL